MSKGKIVQIFQVQPSSSGKGEDLSYAEVTFDQGGLVYRFESGQIEPVYQFIGKAKNPDKKELNIFVHIPALK